MRSAILLAALIIQDGLKDPKYTDDVYAFITVVLGIYFFFDIMDFIKKQTSKK